MSNIVLTDSCFWLGLIDPSDQFHTSSNHIFEIIEPHTIIFPWPCLYETISTHLTRRRDRLMFLERILKQESIVLLDDEDYKTNALDNVFSFNKHFGFTHSLTDSVLREILKDPNVRIDYLVTYNEKDFVDICQVRQIEIIRQ